MSTTGLRRQKRLAAMRQIQAAALDLFDARGFDAVTIEQIAEISGISPRSIYRYFGTKEELVLWDQFDERMSELLDTALADAVPLDGVRRVMEGTFAEFTDRDENQARRRTSLMMANPRLEQAAAARTYAVAETIGTALARHLGRPEADLEVQVFSHALTGGVLGMVHHWHGTGFAEPLRDVAERLFTIFEEGLDIVTAPGTKVPHALTQPGHG